MIHFIDLFAGIGGIRLGVSNALKAHGILSDCLKTLGDSIRMITEELLKPSCKNCMIWDMVHTICY